MTDLSKLSDQELMALLNGGQAVQPTNAQTGEPLNPAQSQTYQQLAATGGLDPQAAPGSARLPKAQINPGDFPDQGQFFVDTQGKVQQVPNSTVGDIGSSVTDRVRAVARGVPVLGAFADEANAATAALLAPALEPALRKAPALVQALMQYDPRQEIGNLPTFGERYKAAENLQRYRDQTFDEAHPKESTAEQIGGGLAGTVAMLPALAPASRIVESAAPIGSTPGLLPRIAAGAVEGGAIGGLHGYGMGEGGASDPSRIRGAEAGGLFGGAAGAALPLVSNVAGTAWRATGGRLVDAVRGGRVVQTPAQAEAERLASILRGENPKASDMKPDRGDLESALVTAQRSDLTTPASEVDDAYMRLARAAERQKMTPEEMAAAVRNIGPFGTLADTGEAARDLLRAAINRPGRGATIAQENLTPRQNGVFDPDTGTWLVRPSSLRISDQAQTGLGLGGKDYYGELDSILAARKAQAGPAYAKAYQAPPVDVGQLPEFSGTKLFNDAYARARGISEKEFVKLPDGSEAIQPLPEKMPNTLDWRTLDLMKQGLDDLVKEGKVQGIGANEQGAIKGYLSRFVGKLDGLNPDYKAARDAFAGPTAMKDALEEGRGLLSEDVPVMSAALDARPESERQMMRLGALQALQTKLGNANVTYDAANQAGLLKPNQLARFKALFPDAKSFADFYRAMQAEKTMHGTNAAAFGNSTTARQILNAMEPSDPQLEGVAQAIPAAAGMNPIALVRAIHRMGMESPMPEGSAETIASVLSSHNAEDLPMVVKRMNAAQRAAYVSDVLRRSMGTGAGQAAAGLTQPGQ
ncbi:hypothetical protein [Phenylobacterium soli]|uniref:Uncharacterized protein n=1 Tax=Phenylobacterium soli TaxID=2170551 RepID=A0A328A9D4_9CAUL|nr:hypothetical protein [Phenylobacterium soli]RAK51191.1 hypothetical protein DJ017_19730 [Phenylobacterium soli]